MTFSNSQRLYRTLRFSSLGLSCLFMVGVPLWHLRASGTGAQSDSTSWLQIGQWLSIPTWPPPLLGAPWTMRLWGLEILDPLAGLGVVVAGGFTPQILFGIIPAIVLVALFGRFFCGWICPYALVRGASNSVRDLLNRVGLRPKNWAPPQRLGWVSLAVVLVVTAVTQIQWAPLIYPPAVLGRAFIRAVFFGGLGVGALVIVAAFLFDTLISRAGFCRYLCPGGALFSLIGAVSPLRIQRNAMCDQCGACERECSLLSVPVPGKAGMGCERCGKCREVCASGALQFTWSLPWNVFKNRTSSNTLLNVPSKLERRVLLGVLPLAAGWIWWSKSSAAPKLSQLRPPGAGLGHQFLSRCIRCMRCAEVCPVQAIRFDASKHGEQAETPFLIAREQPCVLCMKCTQACPTGALQPISFHPAQIQQQVRMGTAIHYRRKCIAWRRQGMCRTCYYVCPFRDQAIILEGHVPVFQTQFCVGCGQCEQACPEYAQAIFVRPRQ